MTTFNPLGDENPPLGDEEKYNGPEDGATRDSLFSALQEELTKEVEILPVTLVLETRPAVALRYLPDIDMELIKRWVRSSRRKNARKDDDDAVNQVRFSKFVLQHTCKAIIIRGNEVPGMTLMSKELIDMSPGSVDSNGAIQWLFGQDSQIIVHSTRVLQEAGYNSDGSMLDVEDNDPLDPSTN